MSDPDGKRNSLLEKATFGSLAAAGAFGLLFVSTALQLFGLLTVLAMLTSLGAAISLMAIEW